MAAPRSVHHMIADDEFAVLARARLLVADPAGQGDRSCANRNANGVVCRHFGDERLAKHGRCCCCGPGFLRRHHGLRDCIGGWLEERLPPSAVAYEQRVPHWDQVREQDTKLAVLDLVVSGARGREYVDVSVAEALAAEGACLRARARAVGLAARDREREKHHRYPGHGLVAAAAEAGGRLGREFISFLKAQAGIGLVRGVDASVARAAALADGKQRAVVAVVRGTAAMMLSAAGGAKRPWEVAAGQ